MHATPNLMGLLNNSISVNVGRNKLFESTRSSTLKFITKLAFQCTEQALQMQPSPGMLPDDGSQKN